MRRWSAYFAAAAAVAVVALAIWRWPSDNVCGLPDAIPGPLPETLPGVVELSGEDWLGVRGGGALTGAVPRLFGQYQRAWSRLPDGRILSGPVVIGARVYAGTDRGEIIGWSLVTGMEELLVETRHGRIEAPLLAYEGDLLAGSLEGHFFRFDPGEKRVVWQQLGEAEIHGGANLVETPAGPLVVWGDYRNNVVAVAAATGEERWRHMAGSYINGAPSTAGERVVVGSCDASLYILRARDGEVLHRFDTGAYVPNSPALVDGVAYSASYNGMVVAVALLDGTERWRTKAGKEGLVASPSVAAGKVMLAFEDGTLVALDQTSGELLWRQSTSGSYQAGVLTDGKLLVSAGMDGRVSLHRVDTGAFVWSEQVGGAISLAPAVVGRRIVVVTQEGELVVLSALPESP